MLPGVQTVRRLSLDLRQTELTIDCVTHQGIPLGIRGVVIYKVGDDFASIANAARRFLDQQAQMDQRVHNVFTGHLRAIVGNMTVEEMIRDREKLTALTRDSSGFGDGEARPDRRLAAGPGDRGLDRLHHQPRAAPRRRRASARPASPRPQADQAATEAEQAADAMKARPGGTRPGQAGRLPGRGRQGEGHVASRPARWPRPAARQQVVVQETMVAELEAQREEQRLQATVRKPADAKAYEQVTLATGRPRRPHRRRRGPRQGGGAAGRRQRPAGEGGGRGRRRPG